MRKILIKELERLKEKYDNTESRVKEITEERWKAEDEYEELKLEEKRQARQMGKVLNSQELKLDNLESEIENYEVRIKGLKEDLFKIQAEYKDDAFELDKIKVEYEGLRKANKKKLDTLKFELEAVKEALQREVEYDLELEKVHEEKLKKAEKEFKEKLDIARKKIKDNLEKAEESYRMQAEPLLLEIKNLDAKIEILENKIDDKPKELNALKNTHEKLLKKYEKVARENALSTVIDGAVG